MRSECAGGTKTTVACAWLRWRRSAARYRPLPERKSRGRSGEGVHLKRAAKRIEREERERERERERENIGPSGSAIDELEGDVEERGRSFAPAAKKRASGSDARRVDFDDDDL